MVLFGREAPPVALPAPAQPRKPAAAAPAGRPPQAGDELVIPPPCERFCLMGFAAQVVLDVCTIVVVFCLKGAFL